MPMDIFSCSLMLVGPVALESHGPSKDTQEYYRVPGRTNPQT